MSLPAPYFQDDAVTIYLGDCRTILPDLPKVDLVLTDPPYGIGFSEYLTYKDKEPDYKSFLWPVMEESERHIDVGWMCVFQTARKCREWVDLFPRDWRLVACPKTFVQILQVVGPTYATDYALIWPVGKPPQRGKGRDWKVSDTANMRFDRGHPCARPLQQIAYLTECLSEPSQLILDPFMGSGTTLVAAQALGRKSIGIEIEEKYCRIAVERLRQKTLPLTESMRHDRLTVQGGLFDGTSTNRRDKAENIRGEQGQDSDRRGAAEAQRDTQEALPRGQTDDPLEGNEGQGHMESQGQGFSVVEGRQIS